MAMKQGEGSGGSTRGRSQSERSTRTKAFATLPLTTALFVNMAMIPVQPLLDRLAEIPDMATGSKRLVVVLGQLGDFDSIEYAQALVPRLDELTKAGIAVQLFAIGDASGADRFAAFTGFPRQQLTVDAAPDLHRALKLEPGLVLFGGPWPGFLLMCAGVGFRRV